MCCQHVGLIKQMKKRGIEFANLKPGDVVALLNRAETILRVMAVLPEKDSYGFLGSYKSPHGRVPLEAIKYVAESLGGGGLNMNRAIKKGLEDLLGRESKAVISE